MNHSSQPHRRDARDRDVGGRRDRRDGDRDRDQRGDRDRPDRRTRDERRGNRDRHYNNDELTSYEYEELEPLANSSSPGTHTERLRRKAAPMGVTHGSHARSPRPVGENGIEKEPKEYGGLDRALWLNAAENGELDVYTCLALSNASTFTPDTQRLVSKIIGCLLIQMLVPALLLLIEVETMEGKGFSVKPINHQWKFRLIGGCMLLYSLNHMYQNCLDECRAMMLEFALSMGLTYGYCWPLLLGEIANLIVGAILVITMYISFINTEDGTELVLNAVAFNFLGGVDAEFVDSKSHADACRNFKDITAPFREVMKGSRFSCWAKLIGGSMFLLRMGLVLLGSTLGIAFVFLPDREDESNTIVLPFKLSFSIPWLF